MDHIFKSILAICFGVAYLYITPVYASYIDTDGLEWRDLTETTSISAATMDAACDDTTFICMGSVTNIHLGTAVSVDNWVWASIEEVRSLLSELTGHELSALNPSVAEINSVTIPQSISSLGITAHQSFGLSNDVSKGFTRSIYDPLPQFNRSATLTDFANPTVHDRITTDGYHLSIAYGVNIGHFMYLQPSSPITSVPEPSSIFLFLFGIASLGYTRRKQGLMCQNRII